MLTIRIAILFCLLLSPFLTSVCQADVFINRQWDPNAGDWKVMPLDLGAGGITIDRGYQNAYGEYMGYDPGPPFFIEAPIIASGEVDDSGKVVSFGSLSFIGSVGLGQNPFEIYVMPSDESQGLISINGPINFEGNSLDPIKVTGGFLIQAGHIGGTDPWNSGQHEMIWSNTEFSSPYVHQNTWNYNPIQFIGGHVTIRNCSFKGFSGFSSILSFHSIYGSSPSPVWDLTIDNCRFEDDSLSYLPMTFGNLRRVEFRNNYFTNNQFSESSSFGMVMFDECGIGAIVGNSAGNNDHNVIRWINSWVSDSAVISIDPSLPLVSGAILIPPDSALAIRKNSVIKFYNSGGLAVEGRLWVDSAVLTSFNDDVYGGDSDLDSIQDYIYHWSPNIPGHTGAISVSPSGYANIRGAKIRYPEGALYAQAVVDIYDTDIRYSEGFGLWFKSLGNEEFVVRKTTIAHNTESGYGSDYSIMFDNAQGGSQRFWLDSVDVFDSERDGVVIRANSGTPDDIKITNCRFISNGGNGLTVEMWPTLDSIEISNCSFVGNAFAGLNASDLYGDSAVIIISNSLFVGNGYLSSPRMGANIRAGIPLLVNNTFAYNEELGLNFYEVARDRVRSVNNLFYRNGSYGYVLTDPGTSVLSHNAFYGNNDGIEEVYYRLPSGLVKTVEEIQVEGGDFATNLHVDPQMSAEEIGTITSVRFDSAGFYSVVTGQAGQFGGKYLRGTAICPDTTQSRWYWVALNIVDSLYVIGDITAVASVGDVFRLFDHHLLNTSPLVEAGDTAEVRGAVDIDGDVRIIDAEPDGVRLVDIGADEYDPEGGHTSPVRVTGPAANAVFIVDDTCLISWQAGGIDSVRVLFSSEPDLEPVYWDTVTASIAATVGSIGYSLPYSLSNDCVVKVENTDDAATYDVSERFTVKPYTLTDLDSQGKLVEYFVSDHSWSFGNFPDKMWPASWYSQFDYETGIDTITGIVYPPYFANELFYNAKPEHFPDWQLWVHAFGVDECYVNLPTGMVYLPSALSKWADFKGAWRGSCFGFGISSAMAFFDSAGFRDAYPEVDSFVQLHDLPLTDNHRLVVNQLLFHQFGTPHLQYKDSHINDTPRELLAQIKDLLGKNFTDGRVLGIGNKLRGGHAVNPYRLDPDTAGEGRYRLYIYDSNFPDTTGAYNEIYILLDSLANTWSYDDMPGWNDANGYCFLMDSAALYLSSPSLKSGSVRQLSLNRFPEQGSIEIYAPGATQVFIINAEGDTTGLHTGIVTNQIVGAEPLIPMTGYPATPLGYILPEASYTVEIASDNKTTMAASVWYDSAMYRYSRAAVTPADIDRLTFNTGLAVTNPDSSFKPCQLMYLQTTSGQERQYVFSGLNMDGGQGYDLYAGNDSTISLYNHGADNVCTIQLWLVSNETATIAVAEDVTIPIAGQATVIPDWSDPELTNVLLARDMDGDGIEEDTIILNVVTSVGETDDNSVLPTRYDLAQNYPNPFNATTNIYYSLPERCQVSIDIFNILGRTVRTLVNKEQPAGRYTIQWDGTDSRDNDVASGVYFYRLSTTNFTSSKKMLLLK